MATKVLIKKKIVIIGNGIGGSQLTAALAKKKLYNITVITPFEYSEVSLPMTKAIAAGPEEHAKVIYPIFQEDDVEYIIDIAEEITSNSVRTRSGRDVPFDALVVATGQKIPVFYPSFDQRTVDSRKAAIAAVHDEIKRANTIVVSGGGPVGVEMASDIKLRNKDKRVILVFSQREVLHIMDEAFRKLATANLQKIGIELFPNEKVISFDSGTVHLKSGKSVAADYYLPCHPTGANVDFLPSGSLDSSGYAIVDDTFKLQGFTNAFAFGNCTNYDQSKTVVTTEDQLLVVLYNVHAFLTEKPLKHHKKSGPSGPVMVAMGHGVEGQYGIGPALPGCLGVCCFVCCCCGPPCSTPAGPGVAKFKNDFNYSVNPKKGMGIHR